MGKLNKVIDPGASPAVAQSFGAVSLAEVMSQRRNMKIGQALAERALGSIEKTLFGDTSRQSPRAKLRIEND